MPLLWTCVIVAKPAIWENSFISLLKHLDSSPEAQPHTQRVKSINFYFLCKLSNPSSEPVVFTCV
jgi:hypothetical protein